MRSLPWLIIATLVLTAPASAQERRARQRQPDSSSGSGQAQAPRAAQPRSEPRSAPREQAAPRQQPAPRQQQSAPREQSPPRERTAAQPRQRSPQPQASPRVEAPAARPEGTAQGSGSTAARAAAADPDRRRAVPRGDRPRGDNPQVGRAVPRQGPPPQAGGRDNDRRNGWRGRSYDRNIYIYPRARVFAYYDYPRRYFPFGYGGYGPGYYYYDRDWYPYSAYDLDYRFNPYRYGYPTGELRLDVDETFAEVWVDGYYAGTVDDFDGVFQALTLEEGTYTIEVAAPGYEPLVFDVRIYPGQKITYRGDLLRARAN